MKWYWNCDTKERAKRRWDCSNLVYGFTYGIIAMFLGVLAAAGFDNPWGGFVAIASMFFAMVFIFLSTTFEQKKSGGNK